MALRATFALFAASIVLIVFGPSALTLTQAALSGRSVTVLEAIGWGADGAPAMLLVFGVAIGLLVCAVLLVALWLPITLLLDAAGFRSWGMYFAAGYVSGGLVMSLASGIQWLQPYSFLALLLGGAALGGTAALVFWLIRRPDWA